MQREMDQVNALLTQVRSLPPFSNGVSQLLALSPADPALVERVKEIVQADPALATQIIKVANSAAFTGQEIVDTVDRAIMRVGVRMVTGTIAQTQLQRTFEPLDEMMGAIWIGNMLSANVASELATRAPRARIEPETAYTYALLHDVGRLVMVRLLGARMQEIFDESPPIRTELARRERALYGFDHVMAGRLLGNRWRLPSDITLVIAAHHIPPAERVGCPPHVTRMIDLLGLVDEIVHLVLTRGEDPAEIKSALRHTMDTEETRELADKIGADLPCLLEATVAALALVDRQRTMMGVKPPGPVRTKVG